MSKQVTNTCIWQWPLLYFTDVCVCVSPRLALRFILSLMLVSAVLEEHILVSLNQNVFNLLLNTRSCDSGFDVTKSEQVYCSRPKEVQCRVWSCVYERFTRKLLASTPRAKAFGPALSGNGTRRWKTAYWLWKQSSAPSFNRHSLSFWIKCPFYCHYNLFLQMFMCLNKNKNLRWFNVFNSKVVFYSL